MESLLWCLDIGHTVATSIAPRCLAATMPALQDTAFVASLAWYVGLDKHSPILSLIFSVCQDTLSHLANISKAC